MAPETLGVRCRPGRTEAIFMMSKAVAGLHPAALLHGTLRLNSRFVDPQWDSGPL